MTLSLKPNLQAFVDEQLKAGRFASTEALVEEALERMMLEELPLDEETLRAIEESEAQIARGEWVDAKEVAKQLRARFSSK